MRLDTFEERYEYLRTQSIIGECTFGSKRHLNQILYKSDRWKKFRRDIIVRDCGKDLGIEDRDIAGIIIVHHINPITIEDVLNDDPKVFDPENVICCADITHKAIHYGNSDLLIKEPVTRCKNDTCPWRH